MWIVQSVIVKICSLERDQSVSGEYGRDLLDLGLLRRPVERLVG